MEGAWDEITKALSIARAIRYAAERHAEAMACLLSERGALRNVSSSNLTKLKRELADYNIQTRRWKK